MSAHPGESAQGPVDREPFTSPAPRLTPEVNAKSDHDLDEFSQDLLCLHDLQGKLLSLNRCPARLLGYTVEEILRIPLRDLIDPKFRDQFDAYLRALERDKKARGIMAVMTRAGDRQLWDYHSALLTESESPVARVIAHNVTERVQARKALRATNEQLVKTAEEREQVVRELSLFRTQLDQSHDAIQVIEPGTLRLLDVNERTCLELGYSRDELLAMTIYDIAPGFNQQSRAHLLRQLNESGFAVIERMHRRKDGTTFPVEVTLREVQLDRTYGIAVARDITERKRTELRLREYERVVEGLEDLIVVVDRDYRYVLANRAYLEYRGLGREQVIGSHLSQVLGQQFFETVVKEKLDECLTGKIVRYEKKDTYPNIGERDVAVSYFPIDGTHGVDRVAIVLKDITERKAAELALRQSEARFQVALKNSAITVFNQDRDLRYTWLHHPTIQRPVSEFLGKTTEEFFGPGVGEDIAEIRRRVLETGVGVRHEVIIPDGRGLHYFDTTVEPLLDSTGAVVGLTGASIDVTELRKATEALREAKKKLTEEKLYLEREIETELGFHDIIGQSEPLKAVMESVAKVATSDATVLLLGETGTGKELVARAIHRLSQRSGSAFIKMNCAAIPTGLLESELFGNEKGAFTGAVNKKIGRLELADKGTLFLDEIGEISLELQPKLLRVLQDHEFERLGGTQTLSSDFRLVAATNRDLAESVRDNEFRSDLYYRLNVFPIHLPPLRNRRDDIPLLVEHFMQKCGRRMNKSITSIPKKTIRALTEWDWPGNIRELENFIERSVILTNGSVLAAPLGELRPAAAGAIEDDTLKAKEREHILQALRVSRGQISGPRGAATRLGLKRTTLQSKLKHLGINPRVPPPG